MINIVDWYFLLLIPVVMYLFLRRKKNSALKFSSVSLIKGKSIGKKIRYKIGKYLILLGSIIFIVALARPEIPESNKPISEKGIDIAMLLDVSGSMQSVDFQPSRLEAARNTIDDFIDERINDRIGLVVFAGNAYTRIPLTLDHDILKESVKDVDVSSVGEDGTAIGMAISVGMNRLKKSDATSKIMILVTDGENNAGAIDPETASNLAKEMGIKIYTIGVGTDKTILPVQVFGVTQYQTYEGGLDESLLTKIAENTGGEYFRAKDPNALSQIFSRINQLEKSNFEHDNLIQYNELAFPLMKIALLLIAIGLILDRYYYIQIP